MQAELGQETGAGLVSKSGVCLEYLKGACTKDTVCPFSHALKDYYVHVCKRKPHACLSKRPLVDAFVSTVSPFRQSTGNIAARCKRSYMLRCVIPSIIPGDQKRAEAVVAVLVRSGSCGDWYILPTAPVLIIISAAGGSSLYCNTACTCV